MYGSRPFPLLAGIATVAGVTSVTPAMRRFTLAAPAFHDPGVEQPGEILSLGWPNEGEEVVLPARGWRFPAGSPEQHWRNFTVRDHDPARGTIDVDFFLHGENGDCGRAARWGREAGVGDVVGFAGPRVHWEPDPGATWTLLVADETGLPALLAIAESLPAGHRALAVAEVGDEDERQEVECAADVAWHWALRGGRPPGATGVLRDAVRGLELPAGPGQAWGGGEALAMRDVREDLRARCPGVVARMRLLGYWKHRSSPPEA